MIRVSKKTPSFRKWRIIPGYQITPEIENPGNGLIHSHRKKKVERTPRAAHCTDRAQTSTTVSGRPSSVDLRKRLCERCAYEEIRAEKCPKVTNRSIPTYILRHFFA